MVLPVSICHCCSRFLVILFFFFFNDTATTEIYTLSLHDALPISFARRPWIASPPCNCHVDHGRRRSEEHTSELQSPDHLVCRLLLEKKKILLKGFLETHIAALDQPDDGGCRGHYFGQISGGEKRT